MQLVQDHTISGAVERERARVEARLLSLRAEGLPLGEIARRAGVVLRFARAFFERIDRPPDSPTVKRRRVKKARRPPKLITQAERSLDFLAGVRWVRASLDYHKDLAALGVFLGDWLDLPRKDQTESLCLFCGGRRSAGLTSHADLRLARPQWLWLSDRGIPVERIAELTGVRTMTVITGVVNEEHRRNVRRGIAASQARRGCPPNGSRS